MRIIVRRVRLSEQEDAELSMLLNGSSFSRWVRGMIVATNSANVATKQPVGEFESTNVATKTKSVAPKPDDVRTPTISKQGKCKLCGKASQGFVCDNCLK